MDLRALRYFVAVVRLASFTRAAEQLFVTQPTISKMIRSLEDSLGEPLLVRDGRQIRPTPAGSIVLEHAERMLREASHLHEDLAGLRGLTHGQLCLGIPPMVGPLIVPLLASFRARHPGIRPRFTESGGLALEAAVSRGEVDLAISVLPVSDDSLAVAPMADYPLWAVLPAGSPPGAVAVAAGRPARATFRPVRGRFRAHRSHPRRLPPARLCAGSGRPEPALGLYR